MESDKVTLSNMNPIPPLNDLTHIADDSSPKLPVSGLEPNLRWYKVYKVDSYGKPQTVYVFSGGFITSDNANPNELFSDVELAVFNVNKTPIIYSPLQIHKDDTIETLKKKIIMEMGIDTISYNELYLFSTIVQKVNTFTAYQNITKNDEKPFDSRMLGQLLLNLNIDIKNLKNAVKPSYTYDNILNLIPIDVEYNINVPLGRKFIAYNDLLFSGSPFDIIPDNNIIYKPDVNNPLAIFENELILNNGNIHKNTILLSTASEMFDYAILNGIDEQYISELYFPLLAKAGINNKAELLENQQRLIKENKKIIFPEDSIKLFNTIDLFYNMYHTRKSEISYIEKGITSFHIILHPETKTILPLDAIFKNIHATKDLPFIKYNPGVRKENIYRLYCEKISKSGKKIPYLAKNLIMNLSRQTGKNRQISLFIQAIIKNTMNHIFIDFENNGNISLRCELKQPLLVNELEELLKTHINPVISNLNTHLEQSGYKLQLFHSFYDMFIEVLSMKYISSITMDKQIGIESHYGCLSSIFNIIEEDIRKGAIMVFKRVENYKEMDAISTTITEAFHNGYNEIDIIAIIMQKFNMDMNEASIKLAEYLNGCNRIQGRFINKTVDIAENAGFTTLINILPFENKCIIEINNINDIQYISTINVYIDSFIRMTQDPGSSNVPLSTIQKICKKSMMMKETKSHIENVVLPKNVQPITFTKAIAFPFGDDDEEGSDDDNVNDYKETEEEDDGFTFEEEYEEETPVLNEPNKTPENIIVTTSTKLPAIPYITQETLLATNKTDDPLLEPVETPNKPVEIHVETVETPIEPFMPSEEVINNGPVIEPDVNEDEQEEGFEFEEEPQDNNRGAEEVNEDEEGFEFEDDYEDDDQPENTEEDEEMKGGGDYDDKKALLDNKPFKKSKIFFHKMKQREPKLFLSKAEGNYDSYSRVCPTNANLQPIILSQEEKDRIDKEFPGSYNKALKYGTDSSNPYYYICPRFWCLLTNSSMSETDVKAGKCGKIIPRYDENNKPTSKIPPGHYVYEFTDDKYHMDKEGNYREHFPGFKESNKHPNGLCIPCCYNNWDSELVKRRRNECLNPEKLDLSKRPDAQNNLYIVGFDKYPILEKRWGFLPPAVEAFFHIDHLKLVNKNNPALINENTPILLRYGVEQSMKQSFVGCIADIYGFKNKKSVSIEEMRKVLSDSMTLDLYIKYHNGSLVSIFQPKKVYVDEMNISKYSDSEFYKSIDTTNEAQMDFLEDTIASFENFLKFLNDENSVIDHMYLWDIITYSNDKLFNGGLNLVVIEITNNDITDNIQILCPTNSYAKKYYDTTKETLILLKHDMYYEPIYLYENKTDVGIKYTKLFFKSTVIKNVKNVLQVIENSSNKYCSPLSSLPKVYKFDRNISLLKLREICKELDLTISSQVMNYQGKIIGIMVSNDKENKDRFFLPCLPSASVDTSDLKIEYIENDIWKDYKSTRDKLLEIHKLSKNKILCKPVMKVLENKLVVGILTQTNQFIQTSPPSENIDDDGIEVLENSNFLLADKVINTTTKYDEDRIQTTKKIYLESQFYTAFRNTLRILLNQYNNKDLRSSILKIIDSTKFLYKDKLKKVETILRTLSKKSITFQTIDNELLNSLNEIATCTTNCTDKKYCITNDKDECSLIVPKNHLVSNVDNEIVYFARIADELIRYNRIRIFMFDTKTYLNITNSEYKLNNNEFIILQSLLTNEYFDDLIPFQMNDYINNITYDISTPDVSQKYTNTVSMKEQLEYTDSEKESNELSVQCISETGNIYGNASNIWRKRIPMKKNGKDIKEIYFKNNYHCSFYVLIHILQMKLNKDLNRDTMFSVANLKTTLNAAYRPYMESYNIKIFDILKKQGKKNIIQKVERGIIQFDTLIMSEEYYLTDLDIWVIANKLNLPIVIFSLDDFKTMVSDINWLVLAGNVDKDDYYFIRSPKGQKLNFPVNYSLIDTPLKLYELKGLDSIIQNANAGLEYKNHFITFDTFIRDYQMI